MKPLQAKGVTFPNRVARPARGTSIGQGVLSKVLIPGARGGVGLTVLETLGMHYSPLLPTDRLEFNGSLSYTNPKYKEYMAPNNATRTFVDFSGFPFGGNYAVPKWQGALAATYRIPMEAKGELRLTGDITFRSRAPTDNLKYYTQTGGVFNRQMIDPGRGLLNLRTDWSNFLGNKPMSVSLFGNNVGDKVYKDGGTQAIGLMSAHYAPPRMFGAEVTYAFGKNQ